MDGGEGFERAGKVSGLHRGISEGWYFGERDPGGAGKCCASDRDGDRRTAAVVE